MDTKINDTCYGYSKEFLVKNFGTETPTVSDRAQKFFGWWCDWKDNHLDLRDKNVPAIRKTLAEYGLVEWEDFILKHNGLRFRDREDLVMFRLVFAK